MKGRKKDRKKSRNQESKKERKSEEYHWPVIAKKRTSSVSRSNGKDSHEWIRNLWLPSRATMEDRVSSVSLLKLPPGLKTNQKKRMLIWTIYSHINKHRQKEFLTQYKQNKQQDNWCDSESLRQRKTQNMAGDAGYGRRCWKTNICFMQNISS